MGITVLIADDHKLFREGLRAILLGESLFNVIGEAEDGQEAVRLTLELRPDVLIMDISMPGMDGIEALKQVIAANPAQNVLVISMHRELHFLIEVFRHGARGFLQKNCSTQVLFQTIRTIAAGNTYYDDKLSENLVKDYENRSLSSRYSDLSSREREVLRLITEGMNTKGAAHQLNLSVKTIEFHRQRIMKKLNLFSVAELTKYSIRVGLTHL